jgi:nicotinamidase-related amidase
MVTRPPGRSALLLMDLMPVLVPAFGGDDAMLDRLSSAAVRARDADVDVVHVRVRFRPGYPEVASTNRVFSAVIEHFDFTDENPATAVHPSILVEPSDIHVTKRRISAFSGSDLDLVLRCRNVDTVVLAGVTTSGVVLSTLRQAADLDYDVKVLSDGCADGDAVVHQVLLEKVFPTHAEVLTTDEWVAALSRSTDPQ